MCASAGQQGAPGCTQNASQRAKEHANENRAHNHEDCGDVSKESAENVQKRACCSRGYGGGVADQSHPPDADARCPHHPPVPFGKHTAEDPGTERPGPAKNKMKQERQCSGKDDAYDHGQIRMME